MSDVQAQEHEFALMKYKYVIDCNRQAHRAAEPHVTVCTVAGPL